MSVKEVDFIGKMILDEVMELFATVLAPADAKTALKGFIDNSKDIAQISAEDQAVLISEQVSSAAAAPWRSLDSCEPCNDVLGFPGNSL